VLIQLAALHLTGAYSFLWSTWASPSEDVRLGRLVVLRGAAGAGLGLPVTLQHWRVPLSVIVMDTVLAFGGVLSLRVLRRVHWERYEKEQHAAMTGPQKPVLVGAPAGPG
jgi:uncharacterized protein (DUF2126 family)